ncbi:hypothetical protein RUM44_010540 [Polyplax serrata]|uniref:DM14 domain-containing protein n=1 Tax=Polyplax serrata TaxID=468196 RepID=A0ABR1AXB8_POLSC
MFSWSKKKESRRRDRGGGQNSEENEFGIKLDKGPSDKQLEAELRALAGVDELPGDDFNINEGEEDEEAELLRLLGGKGKRPVKKPTNADDNSPIDVMADITAEVDLGDEDVEVDEDDPELLGELLELTQEGEGGEEIDDDENEESGSDAEEKPAGEGSDVLSIIKERLKMYKTAEAKAKENNESSRARRFSRGVKTLEDLLKKAKAGKPVSPNDIPPVIAMNLKPAPPVQIEAQPEGDNDVAGVVGESNETQQSSDDPQDIMATLMERLKMYNAAEAKAKESGETTRARRFNRGIKTIQELIKQAKAGKSVAPGDIPPAVALNLKPAPPPPPPESTDSDYVEDEVATINLDSGGEEGTTSVKEPEEEERNIMDVLSERLKMYQTAEEKANEAGETTRARRFNRGIKTLKELIRKATAGKPIPPDDIPPPIALNLKPAPVTLTEEDQPPVAEVETDTLVQSSDIPSPVKFTPVDDEDIDLDDEMLDEETPTTVMEGLEQRVRIYKKLWEKAQSDGNETLSEQNRRIVQAYLSAIKTFKNGGYVDVLKLPNPKGCPPIPIPFHIP